MYWFIRVLSLLSILIPLCLASRPLQARENGNRYPQNTVAQAPVSPDSLERPTIAYHNLRATTMQQHSDMAMSDETHLSHCIYVRRESPRYKVYYQQ